MVEDLSGFGQIASTLLQELRDDYSSKPIMLFALRREAADPSDPSTPHSQVRQARLSEALSYAMLSQVSVATSLVY